MSSLDALRTRKYAASGVSRRIADDTPVAIRMRYIGTGTVTSVTVVTGTSITMITSDGGTDAYAFATYTTIGALVAAINNDATFEAYAVDSLLADATTGGNYQINGAIVAGTDDNGVVCWDMKTDTSVFMSYTVALTANRNFDPIRKFQGHRYHLQSINYFADVNAASANAVRVYLRKGSVESQVWGAASVDVTDTAITFASGQGQISGADGGEIVVRVLNATSLTDHASGYLQVVGIKE